VSKKSKTLEDFIDAFAKASFGRERSQAARESICVMCGEKINPDKDFRDDISRKEYDISGLCQKCQDKVFGDD
jgi:hypothetical protein